MRDRVSIVCDDKNKKLTLALPHNLPDGVIIGPYLAMYKCTYEGYKWENWSNWNKEKITLEKLQYTTTEYSSETYVNSIIINEDLDEYLIEEIVDELGYVPNYFFVIEVGQIELIHIGNPDYSCGQGSYFHDKGNFPEDVKPDIIYNGEYLRCICDTQNNIKSGQTFLNKQEILIPFHIKI